MSHAIVILPCNIVSNVPVYCVGVELGRAAAQNTRVSKRVRRQSRLSHGASHRFHFARRVFIKHLSLSASKAGKLHSEALACGPNYCENRQEWHAFWISKVGVPKPIRRSASLPVSDGTSCLVTVLESGEDIIPGGNSAIQ